MHFSAAAPDRNTTRPMPTSRLVSSLRPWLSYFLSGLRPWVTPYGVAPAKAATIPNAFSLAARSLAAQLAAKKQRSNGYNSSCRCYRSSPSWQHMTFTMPCQYWELVAETAGCSQDVANWLLKLSWNTVPDSVFSLGYSTLFRLRGGL